MSHINGGINSPNSYSMIPSPQKSAVIPEPTAFNSNLGTVLNCNFGTIPNCNIGTVPSTVLDDSTILQYSALLAAAAARPETNQIQPNNGLMFPQNTNSLFPQDWSAQWQMLMLQYRLWAVTQQQIQLQQQPINLTNNNHKRKTKTQPTKPKTSHNNNSVTPASLSPSFSVASLLTQSPATTPIKAQPFEPTAQQTQPLALLSPRSLNSRNSNSNVTTNHSTIKSSPTRSTSSSRSCTSSAASNHPSHPNTNNLFQNGVTVGYTYDALFATDGRSKRRQSNVKAVPSAETETVSPPSGVLVKEETPEVLPASVDQMELGVSQNVSEELQSQQHQRYSCAQCGKSYATSSNLSRHKQTHRSLDSVHAKKCQECGKTYVSMPALSMHLLTHKLQHKCHICDKAFSRPWLLHGHLRSHTGQKPFGCAHCGKAFADRSNLRAHMQTHSGTKRYECAQCGKSFALKSYLTKHQESACTTISDSYPQSQGTVKTDMALGITDNC